MKFKRSKHAGQAEQKATASMKTCLNSNASWQYRRARFRSAPLLGMMRCACANTRFSDRRSGTSSSSNLGQRHRSAFLTIIGGVDVAHIGHLANPIPSLKIHHGDIPSIDFIRQIDHLSSRLKLDETHTASNQK
jgi:hypothetical protein